LASSVGLFLNGNAITGRDPQGRRIVDDSFPAAFHAADKDLDWVLPHDWGSAWEVVLDSAAALPVVHVPRVGVGAPSGRAWPVTHRRRVHARSVQVLRRVSPA